MHYMYGGLKMSKPPNKVQKELNWVRRAVLSTDKDDVDLL